MIGCREKAGFGKLSSYTSFLSLMVKKKKKCTTFTLIMFVQERADAVSACHKPSALFLPPPSSHPSLLPVPLFFLRPPSLVDNSKSHIAGFTPAFTLTKVCSYVSVNNYDLTSFTEKLQK